MTEGVMAQLSRLREWQARAREEMELLQLALDTAAATAVLRHDKPLTEPFHLFDSALTASVPIPAPQPTMPGTPARLPAAAPSSFPQPPFYRSVTEPFQSPYSSQTTPLPPSTPSFTTPFPFPPSSTSNLPSPSSSLAHMPLDQLEARRSQLTSLIAAFQRSAGALLPLGTEPPRNKTHWDYLLQEALWMSGDFQREKRWKVKVAKQLSKAVLQYWQRVREKDARERKAEVARKRKQCAGIAREVRKFWMQIGKLVHYKHTQAVEREKKEAMARHLEILVDQTESYSSQLALDMRKGDERKETEPATDEPRDEEKQSAEPEAEQEEETTEGNLDDILKGLNGGASPSSQHSEERSERSGRRRKRRALDGGSDRDSNEDDKDDGDVYEANESSEEDDEQTLEEEEEQEDAEVDDVDERHAKEVEELNEEAEMSVEELKRKYGIGLPDNDNEQEEDEEEEEEADGEGEEEEERDDAEQDEQMDDGVEEEAREDDEKMVDDEVIPESPPSASTSASPSPTPASFSSSSSPAPASSLSSSHSAEEARLTAASSLASSAQPTGNTLATHKVHTRTPSLLRGSLREYQQVGLDWLASMYTNQLNGILADEMGLGKTVMTIALLGWLACEKGIWGQHLIVVPTSVMINWEMEFKRFLPGLRILCYHGSAKERKEKRKGWMDPNRFHVCITSYQMILQDALIFKRKRWVYLILDEAQNIRNFKSQRCRRCCPSTRSADCCSPALRCRTV